MRYGLVRELPELSPLGVQRRLVTNAGCEVILSEGSPTPTGQMNLFCLLSGLKPGDELVVQSLDVFQATTGELAVLLRRFHEVGVTLHFVGGAATREVLIPVDPVPKVLSLLADHEARRPTRTSRRRSREHRKVLTVHQITHARDQLRKGESLRSIGLLFQLTPKEVLDLIGGETRKAGVAFALLFYWGCDAASSLAPALAY
jgi:hypothetical protein